MTDKVQKIKDWISKTQDGLMDANGNFEYSSDEGAFNVLSNLDYYIDSLQEETISDTQSPVIFYGLTGSVGSPKEEPVSEDLEEAASNYAEEHRIALMDYETGEIEMNKSLDVVNAFKAGAKWQKEQIMANSTDATIGLPYENEDGGYTHLVDVSRLLPVGDNKIAIIFKED